MARFGPVEKLKYFSRLINEEGTLNILLISTSQFYLDTIAHSIYETRELQRENRSYNLKVHTCRSVLDVIEFMPREFYVDYIVFILDSHISSCLMEVENNLTLLDSSFTREKICLLNLDFSFTKSLISSGAIWDFARLHQFNLINGKTKVSSNVCNITERILNLAEASCGILNGLPMINIV